MHSLKRKATQWHFFILSHFRQVVYERTWSVTPWRRIWSASDARKYWYAKRAWKVMRRLNQDVWNKSISLKYSKKCSPKKLLRKVSSRSKYSFKRSWNQGFSETGMVAVFFKSLNAIYTCNVECKHLWYVYPWRWKTLAFQLLQLSHNDFAKMSWNIKTMFSWIQFADFRLHSFGKQNVQFMYFGF